VHDEHAGHARGLEQAGQPGPHRRVHPEVDPEPAHRAVRLHEVPLHVHEHQRRVSRIDQLGELGQHLLALDFDQPSAPLGVVPRHNTPHRNRSNARV
jgi:hypothetical protein